MAIQNNTQEVMGLAAVAAGNGGVGTYTAMSQVQDGLIFATIFLNFFIAAISVYFLIMKVRRGK